MRFAKDILPLLLAGGGMAAAYKSGIFDDPAQKANNDQWANMSSGKNADGSANTNSGFPGAVGAPMQLPGARFMPKNPLAGSVPVSHMSPAFANPNMAYRMPQQMQGGEQPPLLAAGAGPQPMMAQQWAYPNSMQALLRTPQAPQQWANPANINYGLLGNSRVG